MSRTGQGGFTVSELLVVLALMSLVIGASVPAFGRLIPRLELDASTDQLVQDIALARLRAIERRQNTTVSLEAGARGWRMDPWKVRRTLPTGVVATTFPNVTFDDRGLLVPIQPVVIVLNGRRGLCTITVSAAGRVRVQR